MAKIIEAANLPLEDKVYLKKDMFGYRVVHPIKNQDGSWNWFNVLTGGSWANLLLIIFIVGTICFSTWSHYHDVEAVKATCAVFKNDIKGGVNYLTNLSSSLQ